MTRDEHRNACLKAMAVATYEMPDDDMGVVWWVNASEHERALQRIWVTAAFDALPTAGARVVPSEATDEMEDAAKNIPLIGLQMGRSFPELTYRRSVFDAMSAAGDLTNPPEKKP